MISYTNVHFYKLLHHQNHPNLKQYFRNDFSPFLSANLQNGQTHSICVQQLANCVTVFDHLVQFGLIGLVVILTFYYFLQPLGYRRSTELKSRPPYNVK